MNSCICCCSLHIPHTNTVFVLRFVMFWCDVEKHGQANFSYKRLYIWILKHKRTERKRDRSSIMTAITLRMNTGSEPETR